MDCESQIYSYDVFGNWYFRFILSQSSQGSQSYFSYIFKMLAFIKLFLLNFVWQRPALAAHTHHKNHFKIVA